MSAVRVSIVIPTQRRAESLRRAMDSALAQVGIEAGAGELVVIDNDVSDSARQAVEAARAGAPFSIRYVHEPRSGVANARNTGVAAASGELIAFLDDDEVAPEGWLRALLAAQSHFDADVVFGPVQARAPAAIAQHRAYLELFFSRVGSAPAGPIDHYFGCGNSLVRRSALPDAAAPFSPLRNQIGGEDDLLFDRMQRRGARFAWAPAAWVWEDPAPERLSLSYTLRRAFAYGQGPTSRCAAADPVDWRGVLGWLAVGVGQAVVFGLLAGLKWMLRAPDRAFAADRAARGFGKVFWWGPFKIKFYGLTIVPAIGMA